MPREFTYCTTRRDATRRILHWEILKRRPFCKLTPHKLTKGGLAIRHVFNLHYLDMPREFTRYNSIQITTPCFHCTLFLSLSLYIYIYKHLSIHDTYIYIYIEITYLYIYIYIYTYVYIYYIYVCIWTCLGSSQRGSSYY